MNLRPIGQKMAELWPKIRIFQEIFRDSMSPKKFNKSVKILVRF